ncbi:DUF4145 domain-containing protein [Sphingomonas olei]
MIYHGADTSISRAEWRDTYQVCSACRHCKSGVLWRVRLHDYAQKEAARRVDWWRGSHSINDYFDIAGFQSIADFGARKTPEHTPDTIAATFQEAAKSQAIGCYNASVSMSRLCLDLSTKSLLPSSDDQTAEQPNRDQRKVLFHRVEWLISQRRLPEDLSELSHAIRLLGSDGAHDGTCTEADALDLLEFTEILLDRVFTIPERVRLVQERSAARRA